jgi:ABC-type antimicrobial peptide transport system permease subunit
MNRAERVHPKGDCLATFALLTHEELVGIWFIAALMAALGVIALVLASSGVYGVMASSVTERTREIGIRMALGAERGQMLHWIAVRGIRLAAIGLAIGIAAAFALARVLASLIFGVSPTDPLIFAGVPAFLAAVAMAACYLPARPAMRVDPIIALRYE